MISGLVDPLDSGTFHVSVLGLGCEAHSAFALPRGRAFPRHKRGVPRFLDPGFSAAWILTMQIGCWHVLHMYKGSTGRAVARAAPQARVRGATVRSDVSIPATFRSDVSIPQANFRCATFRLGLGVPLLAMSA